MAKKLKIAFSMAAAVAMLGMALAIPVNAQSNILEPATSEDGTIYVAAGILGDVQIGPCIRTVSGATVAAQAVDSAGNPIGPPVTASVPVSPPVDVHVCAGGDVRDYVNPNGGFSDATANYWEVDIKDFIWDGTTATPGVETVTDLASSGTLKIAAAGLARIQATYIWRTTDGTSGLNAGATCVPSTPPTPAGACLAPYGSSDDSFRNTNVFGVCGRGTVEVNNDKMNPASENSAFPVEPGTYGQSAQVFVDGAVFFQLDCPMADEVTNLVGAHYNDLTQSGDDGGSLSEVPALIETGCLVDNMNPVPNMVFGPAGECVAVNDYICNDAANPITKGAMPDGPCLFPLPAQATACFPDGTGTGVSVTGIVGVVRMDFNAADVCTGAFDVIPAHDPWGNRDSEDFTVGNIWVYSPDVEGEIGLT